MRDSRIGNISSFAPVIIPTLCRYEHFRRCVESLSKCTHADKTELIIGLDYPAEPKHDYGYHKILEYLDSGRIDGFKNVVVFKTDVNLGVNENYKRIKEYAFSKYDRLIASEDDNEFSPAFLDYINSGLDRFEDDSSVMAICGYNYPIDMGGMDNSAYKSQKFSAWGVAYWREKSDFYVNTVHTEEYARAIFRSPFKFCRILFKNPRLLAGIRSMLKENVLWGDVMHEASHILEHQYAIFPRISLVRNWGHDGSGVNCDGEDNSLFIIQPISDRHFFDWPEHVNIAGKTIRKRLNEYYGVTFGAMTKKLIVHIFKQARNV